MSGNSGLGAATVLILLGCTALPLAGQAEAPAAEPPKPVIAAPRTGDPIRIDGLLDEPAWQTAGIIADLTQADPQPGEATPFKTEIRILVDFENVYVAFICTEPEMDQLRVHTLQRDGELGDDDNVTIVFDTFGDHRSGYFFRVNAAGAKADGLQSGGGGDINYDWDGIWTVKTARGDGRWIVEMAFPTRTLRFKAGQTRWGINFEREVAREQLVLRWTGISLNGAIEDLQRTGEMTGVEGLEQGRGLTISPYGVAQWEQTRNPRNSTVKATAGLDLTYNLTPQLAAVLALNPDFGEAEADSREINLSRFPLFFPEKRPFFAEGSNSFDFNAPFNPFYSRRIGVYDERKVPIDAGIKILGRMGRWGIGLLDVETRDSAAAPRNNMAAGRVTFDFNSHLQAGLIGTWGHPDGESKNSFAGADFKWQTARFMGDKNLSFSGWLGRAGGDLPAGSRSGGGVAGFYLNDRNDFELTFNQYGDAMIPELGFLQRSGVRQYHAGATHKPRPQEDGPFDWARQFEYEVYWNRTEDLHGRLLDWDFFLTPFSVTTESDDGFEVNLNPRYEVIDEAFDLAPGVVIEPGAYRYTRWRVRLETAGNRPVSGGFTFWRGGYYDGRLDSWNARFNWTALEGKFQLGLEQENDYGYFPSGKFILRLTQLKTIYSFSPDLSVSAFFQYDSESRNLGMNSRLRWTLKPGCDLFVVWNRGWQQAPGGSVTAFSPTADQILVKLRWTFRI